MGGKDVRMRCLESRAETEHHPHQKGESFKNAAGKREEVLQDERQPHARMPGGSAGTQRAGGGRQGPLGLAGGTSEQQRYRTRRTSFQALRQAGKEVRLQREVKGSQSQTHWIWGPSRHPTGRSTVYITHVKVTPHRRLQRGGKGAKSLPHEGGRGPR